MQKTIVIRMLIRTHIPRFENGRFPEFFQFRLKEKEFAVEMKILYDFPYFLMHIRPFDEISNYKTNLT